MKPLDRTSFEALNAGAPPWIAALRERGFEHFEKLAMPDQTEEVWRYIEFDFELDEFQLPDSPGTQRPAQLTDALGALAGKASVVDGFTLEAESDAGKGVTFGSLAEAIDSEIDISEFFGTGVAVDLDVFSAAHHAFSTDAVVLRVPAGVAIESPFYVDVQSVTPESATFPRVTIIVEGSAEASIIVGYSSPDDARLLAVPQIEAFVADAGHLKLSVVQQWGGATRAVAQLRAVIGRDANVHFAEAGIGAKLGRLHFTVDLAGAGAHSEVTGLYFGDDDQVLDYRAFINHVAPNTSSNMLLKGAVEDEAHSVFTGLIRIEEEAQKTNAFQTNRNLVLSDGAGAESVPNLEILANDVRCGHASTVGPLDEDQRYYLMSRGLTPIRADRLQVRGFFEEVLHQFPHPDLTAPIRLAVNDKYVRAQEEGRV